VVACVGRDMIKVWPLPVEQPWCEDALGVLGGEPTRRVQNDAAS
jgi:hypothetical protein